MRPIYWHRFPFLFLVIPLILGITASQYLSSFPSTFILGVIIISFSLLFIIQKVRSGLPFVLLAFTELFSTGIYLSETKTPSITAGKTYQLTGRCNQILSPGKLVISSPHLCTYLQIPDSMKVSVGDSLSGLIRLYPLQTSHNRHDFNYNNYLQHQGIQAKGFPVGEIHKTGHSQDLYSVCHMIRNNLATKLQQVIPDSTTYKLLAALCLGCRQEITSDTKELFQNTGTIHILAISGLHIGAIFAFFLCLLRLFHFKSRKSRLILIPLIWFVACITGLSPSACRAATILSFITIGEVFKQETIPLNAIAAAAFFSLLINPELLYSVSFQMSYAAYTGIILIYPLMRIKKMHKFFRPLYTLLCISFSAQVMTLPIMAYYFHSISLNSIFINLIAVPAASFLLYGGILLLALPGFINFYLSYIIISLTHLFIFSLQLFSKIVINLPDLYPTATHVILFYLIIVLVIIYLITRKRHVLKFICYSMSILLVFHGCFTFYIQNHQEIVIRNLYKHSAILLNYKGYYTYLKTTNPDDGLSTYITANHLQALPTHEAFVGQQIKFIRNHLSSPQCSISIIDHTYPTFSNEDIVIITENIYPPDSLKFHPQQIIMDNSNTGRCTQAWQKFCLKNQIPFFKTSEVGTIILKI
ncbi:MULTISPECIES: ComEC/Rec2 family competence protein [Butyricimonas]|nr:MULTISPECIES: ComEC/Rec2 family competence protein [Butyricimonas]MBS6687935.1 ComEC/Rec2 family competence protein [Sanguibacteroides justesenii]